MNLIKIKEKTQDEQDYISMMRSKESLQGKLNIANSIGCGSGFISLGIITFPVPCGSIQMITFGTIIILNPKKSIKKRFKELYWMIKTKYKCMGWKRR